jgi:hypothetical protein
MNKTGSAQTLGGTIDQKVEIAEQVSSTENVEIGHRNPQPFHQTIRDRQELLHPAGVRNVRTSISFSARTASSTSRFLSTLPPHHLHGVNCHRQRPGPSDRGRRGPQRPERRLSVTSPSPVGSPFTGQRSSFTGRCSPAHGSPFTMRTVIQTDGHPTLRSRTGNRLAPDTEVLFLPGSNGRAPKHYRAICRAFSRIMGRAASMNSRRSSYDIVRSSNDLSLRAWRNLPSNS